VTILGVLSIIAGMLCMMMPGIVGLSVVTLVGVFVLVAGILRMIWAFKAGSVGKGILGFLLGVLTVLGGVILLANPILGSGILTILLAVYFIVDGISELAAGFQRRPVPGSGWLIFGGIVSILLGIMIWAQFPLSGMWAIGILFGIKLFFVGMLMVMTGSTVRGLAKHVEGSA